MYKLTSTIYEIFKCQYPVDLDGVSKMRAPDNQNSQDYVYDDCKEGGEEKLAEKILSNMLNEPTHDFSMNQSLEDSLNAIKVLQGRVLTEEQFVAVFKEIANIFQYQGGEFFKILCDHTYGGPDIHSRKEKLENALKRYRNFRPIENFLEKIGNDGGCFDDRKKNI